MKAASLASRTLRMSERYYARDCFVDGFMAEVHRRGASDTWELGAVALWEKLVSDISDDHEAI